MNQFVRLMTLQNFAGIISLGGAIIVIAVVIFLIVTSNKSIDEKSAKNNFFKSGDRYFWGTSLLLIIILLLSLQLLPPPHNKGGVDEVVSVAGVQWDWQMLVGISNKSPDSFLGKNEISLPVNKRIKFIVTSGDVIHNFGIYTWDGVLLTQIQAIPEYKNELHYVFIKKGNYKILCLEYCGLAHAFMTATIHVY